MSVPLRTTPPICPTCGSDRTVELGTTEHGTVHLCRDCDEEFEVTPPA